MKRANISANFYACYAFIGYQLAVFIIVLITLTICPPAAGLTIINDFQAITRNWPLTMEGQDHFLPGFYPDAKHYFFVIARAKPGHSLLSNESVDELTRLDSYIQNGYTFDSFNFTYSDICLTWEGGCYKNIILFDLLRFRFQNSPNQKLRITWPIAFIYNRPMYLGSWIGGPKLDENGTIIDATAIRMGYFTKQMPAYHETQSLQWRIGMQKNLNNYRSDVLDFSYENEETLKQHSPLIDYKFAPHISVVVENPPDFNISSELEKMLELVQEFEDSNYSIPAGTQFWLRNYLDFLGYVMESTELSWCADVQYWPEFIETADYSRSRLSVKWGNASLGEDKCQIKAFRFFITPKPVQSPEEQISMMSFFKNVSDSFPQYRVSSYIQDIYPIIA